MSDCSTNAWRVPTEREPGVIYQHGLYDAAMIAHVSAIEVEGVRFERMRECPEVMIDKYWRGCGECGYIWEYMYAIGHKLRPNYCPECGAKVVGE